MARQPRKPVPQSTTAAGSGAPTTLRADECTDTTVGADVVTAGQSQAAEISPMSIEFGDDLERDPIAPEDSWPRKDTDSSLLDAGGDGSRSSGDSPEPAQLPLSGRVEVLLMTSEKPLTAGRIADLLELTDGPSSVRLVELAIDGLNATYASTDRAFRIERIAGGFRMMTLPAYGTVVRRIREANSTGKLSQAALETLAIVAYRQPITRSDVEAIRGVACGEVLRTLLERRLIRISGRAEEIGRPMLYGTTREFLEAFGLSGLADLPQQSELKGMDVGG